MPVRMVLHPDLAIGEAFKGKILDVFHDRLFRHSSILQYLRIGSSKGRGNCSRAAWVRKGSEEDTPSLSHIRSLMKAKD
jgi:hypothetical protein